MAFEPFLEPWVFVFQQSQQGNDKTIKLTDSLYDKGEIAQTT